MMFARRPAALAVLALILGCSGTGPGPDDGGGPPGEFFIGGAVSGLSGSGLALQVNGGSDLPVFPGDTSYRFVPTFASGASYQLTVRAQPVSPSQICTIANASGRVGDANVDAPISCTTSAFAVGGTIRGLTGAGLSLSLNGGAPLSIAPGTAGFHFDAVPTGSTYDVTVAAQPSGQTCTITNGRGRIVDANVGDLTVTCRAPAWTIGGAITGLGGAGLVLQNNGKNDLGVDPGATQFVFPGNVPTGASYAVTAKSQPAGQTCSVANATGTATANVTNVVLSCVDNTAIIGGTVTGLAGAGLALQLNGGPVLSVPAGATGFTFSAAVAPGTTWAVTVSAHPVGQSCAVANGSGTATGSVTNVAVTCTDSPAGGHSVGGTITGLTQSGLVLQLNGSALSVPAGATTFTFPALPPGTAWNVFAAATPTFQWCTISNGSGTIASTDVTDVTVACVPKGFKVKGIINGLTGTGLNLLLNGGGRLVIAPGTTTFAFGFNIPIGATYQVTVAIQPTSPRQVCTVANGSGVMGTADQTDAIIDCVTSVSVGGTVGPNILWSNGGTLLLNGTTPLELLVDHPRFSFDGLPTGVPYSVTVGQQPSAPPHDCVVTNGSGIVGSSDVTSIQVNCVPRRFALVGLLTGYTGGLTLKVDAVRAGQLLPARPPLTPQGQTKYAFTDQYQPGDEYRAYIGAQPAGKTCTIRNAVGLIVPQPDPTFRSALLKCVGRTSDPLTGVYTALQGNRRHFLALWPDGSFTSAMHADDATCSDSGNGVEYGAYDYDAGAGTLTLREVTIDTTDACGLAEPMTTPAPLPVAVTGSTLTLTLPSGALSFTKVPSPGGFVGAWHRAAGQDGAFIAFLPDGTYVAAEPQGDQSHGLGVRPGTERGCYTVNASSLTVDLSAACTPDGNSALDTNGALGLSSAVGPVPFMQMGPDALTIDNVALVRFP